MYGIPMYWNWAFDWDTSINIDKKTNGHHWQATHELELGIRLGHIRWFIDKMTIEVMNGTQMYWNWVFDWVTSIHIDK